MPGVFVSLLLLFFTLLSAFPANAELVDCAPPRELQPVQLERVIDGDTVQLRGGERVRLIGLNAPELGRNGTASEPLAARARQALTDMLPRDRDLYLQPGAETKDRHGRRLAHLFLRRDGGSVEAALLRRGFAFQVAMPPNIAHVDCFAAMERAARRAGLGIWNDSYFTPRDSQRLSRADAGFRRVRLQVESVVRDRGGWWLEGGALSVRLHRKALPVGSAHCAPDCWRGHSLTLRGWLIDRSSDRAVRDKGHPPLLLRIDHPAMIEALPVDITDPAL